MLSSADDLPDRCMDATGALLNGSQPIVSGDTVHAEGSWEEGLRQGPWQLLYADGTRSAEGSFEQGREHGSWSFWTEQGARHREGTYLHGELHGSWTTWREDETVWSLSLIHI